LSDSRRHRRLSLSYTATIVALFVGIGLGVPASVQAASCEAPPGTAGIDQYCESIPGAGGNRGSDDGAGEGDRSSGRSLPPATRRELRDAGADGTGVLALTDGRAGAAERGSATRGPKDGASKGDAPRSGSPSSNPFSAVSSSIESGATASPGFAIALLLVALAALGFAWVRYRSAGEDAAE
jgi:hypothetical protein